MHARYVAARIVSARSMTTLEHCSATSVSVKKRGGLAAIMWLEGCDFPMAFSLVADHLGIKPDGNDTLRTDTVAVMARMKSVPVDSLTAFGTKNDTRNALHTNGGESKTTDRKGNPKMTFTEMKELGPVLNDWPNGRSRAKGELRANLAD